MIRLCYLADPVSVHTVKWVSYFLRQPRYEVHLMGWCEPTDPALDAVHFHYLPEALPKPLSAPIRGLLWHSALWPLAQVRQFQLLLKQVAPDIFDILMLNASQFPAAFARRGPLVITPWGSDLLQYPREYGPITRLFLRLAMRRASLVLCNSAALASASVHFGVRASRLRSVGQIVDLRVFRPGLDKPHARTLLGVTGDPVLLSPRLILPTYRIDTAISALARVREVYPGATLIQLGDPQLCPEYSAELTALIERLGLQEAVVFPGRQPYQMMPAAFAASDVVLSLPYTDSRPSSVFEAMACGIPTVVSDLHALREIVRDEETGLIVPVSDPRATGDAAIRLLQDTALRSTITANALSYVRQEGDYETQMQRVMCYYDELLGSIG